MDPVSSMILISIGNVVAWLAAIYIQDAVRGLLGNVVISTIGAFVAGYAILKFLSEPNAVGVVFGAAFGSVLLLYATRLRHIVGPGVRTPLK